METLQTRFPLTPALTDAALSLGQTLSFCCRSIFAITLSSSARAEALDAASSPSSRPGRPPAWQSYAVYSGAQRIRDYKSSERNP